MMNDSAEYPSCLEGMLGVLRDVDDAVIMEIIKAHTETVGLQLSIMRAYKSLLSEPTGFLMPDDLVRKVGIVGAASVPTALWPYLIVAHCYDIPVKLKVTHRDFDSLQILAKLISTLPSKGAVERTAFGKVSWDVTVKRGDELMRQGHWDDCDRIIAFGSDTSVNLYQRRYPEQGRVIAFGNVVSVLVAGALQMGCERSWMVDLLTYEHSGCLAPRLLLVKEGEPVASLATMLLSALTGHVEPNTSRAVSLRIAFHELRIVGTRAWLSDDGMWLISEPGMIGSEFKEGHLQITTVAAITRANLQLGAVSVPGSDLKFPAGIPRSQLLGAWLCSWGNAQFPTLNWRNGGYHTCEVFSPG